VERVYVVRRVARCGDFGGETGIVDLEPIIDGFLDLQVSRLSCESLSGN
jgi:hypothetical protein